MEINKKDLQEFVEDHIKFSEKIKAYFRQLPIMSQEARKALRTNVCNAEKHIYLEEHGLYIPVNKLDKFKKIIAKYSPKTS